MSTKNDIDIRGGGFDAAVSQRKEDKLNRWAFASEIYGIATTGPKEWPVRIGIYGEWGTGKTSVLNMIATLAESHGHIVVRFNPWEYSERKSLWHAFVQAVIEKIPAEAVDTKQSWKKCLKKRAAPISEWLLAHSEDINAVAESKKAGVALLGLDLLKGVLYSKEADLKGILQKYEKGRLIILVDDLDRTSSKIVPEMLYAIKEIMNCGGIVFICAFDPVVVGKILAKEHEGFDDGLKFLEKIIDYPRWLPAVSKDDLLHMAESDVSLHCPYVPINVLASVIPYLPQNARSVRQFVRLLSLMKIQVERHRADEVNWPIILAANVIKIRFPRLAPALLEDRDLWDNIRIKTVYAADNNEAGELIKTHIQKVKKDCELELTEKEQEQIGSVLLMLSEHVSAWIGIDDEKLMYQMRLAEAPAAVTLKEYDSFFTIHREKPSANAFDVWIKAHADKVGQSARGVYRALFQTTVLAREESLNRAAETIDEDGMTVELSVADDLLKILEVLAFDLRTIDEHSYELLASDFELVLDSFKRYLHFTNTSAYVAARQKETDFLCHLVDKWQSPVAPLVEIIEPFSSYKHDIEREEIKDLYKMMSKLMVPRYAAEVLEQFKKTEFRSFTRATYPAKQIVLDCNGPLWCDLRKEMLRTLEESSTVSVIRQNAYELIAWFNYLLKKESSPECDALRVIKVLSEAEIVGALWNAATAQPLNPRAVGSLRDFPANCKKLCNVELKLPHWWVRILEDSDLEKSKVKNAEARVKV
ncbi:MAG: P-loop NTPase fold protein [bacterium]